MPLGIQGGVNGAIADAWNEVLPARGGRWFAVSAVHGVPAIGRSPVDFVLTSGVPLCSMMLDEKETEKGNAADKKAPMPRRGRALAFDLSREGEKTGERCRSGAWFYWTSVGPLVRDEGGQRCRD
ncbi:hypothetical protein JCM14719A_12080 [Calditerricola satsumensis]|uniref:Uncharacterized protein n=1 Tax=Calditerricola satsumensis TaxID=373054 RepID=A0A8J3B3F1_9BACI|nr:hypothetical protein GCM10007043_02970 [Calditerricola satsumensis]